MHTHLCLLAAKAFRSLPKRRQGFAPRRQLGSPAWRALKKRRASCHQSVMPHPPPPAVRPCAASSSDPTHTSKCPLWHRRDRSIVPGSATSKHPRSRLTSAAPYLARGGPCSCPDSSAGQHWHQRELGPLGEHHGSGTNQQGLGLQFQCLGKIAILQGISSLRLEIRLLVRFLVSELLLDESLWQRWRLLGLRGGQPLVVGHDDGLLLRLVWD